MSKDLVLSTRNRSLAASHPGLEDPPLLIAPSTDQEFNTVRSRLLPKACFKLEDNNFEFDSSFITVLTFDAGPLKELLDSHPGAKLSIFGHADPVGRDDYNKTLSGRRAQALYGLLIRDVRLWEDLYFHHDMIGKDPWGVKSIQLMLNRVGPTKAGSFAGELDPSTRQALKDFEDQQKLPPKGFNAKKEVSPETFRRLAGIYMDAICTDDDNKDFRLKRQDFLARGKGKDGKGDFQGCGEFNPLMLFSASEKAFFDKKENHADRNSENKINRRVMILLFRAGSQVDPEKWPCPTATQDSAGCRQRFFSDAPQRSSNQAERRTFEQSQKDPAVLSTFACRFYERLMRGSPCETFVDGIDIRVYDAAGRFIPNAPFRLFSESRAEIAKGFADQNGHVIVKKVPTHCTLTWGLRESETSDTVPDQLPFRLRLRLDFDEGEQDDQALRCLNNLGYIRGTTDADNIEEFQEDFEIPLDDKEELKGKLGPKTRSKILEVHRNRADELRS